ncbi:MAG TPA: metallophosphoesterase [Streptosporangiaceae bacterium]|nr:metallophosphoesterase [Streptosporangiaceae bacterium]
MKRLHRRVIAVSAAGITLAAACVGTVLAAPGQQDDNAWPYAQTAPKAAVLAAVGDIACEPDNTENSATPAKLKCGSPTLGGLDAQFATADQIESMHPDLVALLGDEQYEVGKLSDFEGSFDKSYGAFKFLQRPAPGNHEFYPYTKSGDNEAGQNGVGYYDYYNGMTENGSTRPNGQAGESDQGWYSYDLGAWHIISLNIECNSPAFGNSCDPTTGVLGQETQWLANDLSSDTAACTLAYWHQPTFSSTNSPSAEGTAADAWWKLLYAHGADLILNGHEHVYARMVPMDPNGVADPKHGIPEFIIGTGGEALDTLARNPDGSFMNPNVVTGQDQAYGAMKLTLGNDGYSWDYKPVLAAPGAPASALSYEDSGSAKCHDAPQGS